MIAGVYCALTLQNWVSAKRYTELQYNANNKPVKELYYEKKGSENVLLFAINYDYDANGNIIKIYQTES